MKKQEFKKRRRLGTSRTTLSKKKKIKIVNSKMTTNSKLSTTEPKKQKQTKQTTRTGTESQKLRSHGGLSVGRREIGEKIEGISGIIGR